MEAEKVKAILSIFQLTKFRHGMVHPESIGEKKVYLGLAKPKFTE